MTSPPFHHQVFVLTHHVQAPIPMEGGTDVPLRRRRHRGRAASRRSPRPTGKDVRLNGGASTVQQYLRAGLVDDLHSSIAPVLLGSGERLFEDLDGALDGYEVVKVESSPAVTHVHIDEAVATATRNSVDPTR